MKIKYEWETIQKQNECIPFPNRRVKVFGGWLVENFCCDRYQEGFSMAMTTTFVPDHNHEWEIEN